MKTINLHETTGNDKLRIQLEYIYLQDMNNIVATDSVTLFYSTFKDVFGINPAIMEDTELIEDLVNSGIYIHKTEFKKIANKELSDVVTYDKERQEIRFTDIKGNVFLVKYETKISGTYPYWERVLVEKKDASNVEKIAFNPEMLERINKVCKPMNASIVRFYLYATNKAVLFECSNADNRKVSGLIMPMRFEH